MFSHLRLLGGDWKQEVEAFLRSGLEIMELVGEWIWWGFMRRGSERRRLPVWIYGPTVGEVGMGGGGADLRGAGSEDEE